MKTAVILLGHGSLAQGGNNALAEVALLAGEILGAEILTAYLQFREPTLAESVAAAVVAGAGRVVVMPYFLDAGNHVTQDIPEEIERLKGEHPGLEFVLTPHLGAHGKLAEIVVERINGSS